MCSDLSRRHILLAGAAASVAALTNPANAEPRSKIHDVRIKDFVYVPETLQVHVGDIVRWINDDLAPHTATALEFGWDTGELKRGESAEVVISENMETAYFCVFHPHMKAQLVIS